MEAGNPSGQPVLVFHGGPGGCARLHHAAVFGRRKFRVILFDQRGAAARRRREKRCILPPPICLTTRLGRRLFCRSGKSDTARRFMGIDAGAAVCRKISRTGQDAAAVKNFPADETATGWSR